MKMAGHFLDPEKSCKSSGSYLSIPFKNTHETAWTIKGVHVGNATKYWRDVTLKRHCGGS